MLEQFLQYIETEKRFSNHTLTAYRKDIDSFLEFALIKKEEELKEVTYQNIRAWIVELIESNHSNRTVNRKLSSLRTFFKWAQRSNLISTNPMAKIKGPKQEKRLPEFVKEEEIEVEKLQDLFPDTWEGARDRLIIEVLYQTGIRLTELIHLKRIDVQNQSIRVIGKRNKERIIPITLELEKQLLNYEHPFKEKKGSKDFVFFTDKGNKLYPNFVYRKVNHYLSLITNLQKKSPHILRHTFATHMLNNGAGLETLKELLGHADLSATQVYTHNSFDQISKIYNQAHPRGHEE